MFAEKLLKEAQIAATPGVDFGRNNTERYLRFSYTRDMEHSRIGIERLERFLA